MKTQTQRRPISPATADSAAVIELVDIRRRFGEVQALDGISLTVGKGEVLGIIGRSGAGKSTLIRCLNGLEKPDAGAIRIEGRDIVHLSERELQPLRRRIGMIFQHFNLLSAKTVEENVALPLKIEGLPKAKRLARARELLELVGLSDKASAYPASLSGGQKQRVGIARALAANPALLLSDEATSALDPETTRSILALLRDINRKLGLTIVLITHEMDVVRAVADRVAVIENGKIVEEDAVWRVFSNPKAEITRSLLQGSRPQLPEFWTERLGPQAAGSDAIFSIDVAGEDAVQPVLVELAKLLPLGLRIVHGGIDHIQSNPVARYFVAVRSNDALIDQVKTTLTAHGARMEALGYVTNPV
ncbi:ATP-binding cassette domain-containing protein [Rhizobium sp. CG5]|uniref:methionine ABC transporter ATP-binding protein n=1 Tax=Rhizobium sp. CG5 TaxID=2726076 RepID=UPI002034767A|nr:ATP-binding cassette domain-containing protein [Rhizobium sp. CG5]MCM2474980.1 ATP-binding cassette domain-containing protein [Rhizobium sp. CG5]